jgi:hypothetical protein
VQNEGMPVGPLVIQVINLAILAIMSEDQFNAWWYGRLWYLLLKLWGEQVKRGGFMIIKREKKIVWGREIDPTACN